MSCVKAASDSDSALWQAYRGCNRARTCVGSRAMRGEFISGCTTPGGRRTAIGSVQSVFARAGA